MDYAFATQRENNIIDLVKLDLEKDSYWWPGLKNKVERRLIKNKPAIEVLRNDFRDDYFSALFFSILSISTPCITIDTVAKSLLPSQAYLFFFFLEKILIEKKPSLLLTIQQNN